MIRIDYRRTCCAEQLGDDDVDLETELVDDFGLIHDFTTTVHNPIIIRNPNRHIQKSEDRKQNDCEEFRLRICDE